MWGCVCLRARVCVCWGCPVDSLQQVSSPILPFHWLHCHAERPLLRGLGALPAPRLYFVHYEERLRAESNPAGRCAVWPDNVRVVKRDDEEVSADVRGASRRSWSVHSNPCPTGPHSSPRAMTKNNDRFPATSSHRSPADLLTPSLSPSLSLFYFGVSGS